MRLAIRDALKLNIADLKEVYEPNIPNKETEKPYAVTVFKDDTKNGETVGYKRNIEVWFYDKRLSFKSLDKLDYKSAFINCLTSNTIYIVLIWLLGISILGIPIIIIILILKSFTIGFTISSILYFYKFKGLIIAIIYIIPLLINLFAIIYLSYYAIMFSKNFFNVKK